jgi:Xaa-Pro dipeptidase
MFNKKYTDKLRKLMANNNINAIIIGPSVDLDFLTGFNPRICERFQALFLLSDGQSFHISPQLYFEEAEKHLSGQADLFMWKDSESFLEAVEQANRKYQLAGKTIAINSTIRGIDLLELKDRLPANFVSGHELLEALRIKKEKSEVEKLRIAAQIADEVVGETIGYINPGRTEKDIKKKIEELFAQRGASLAFDPIVASGPNSSMPHYCDDSRIIQKEDILILDLGCQYEGYCSDISRTVFVGNITEEQEKVYHIVLQANQAAEAKARIGVSAEDVDKAARDIITQAGYGQYFLNRTGHGIGISVHEAPYIRTGNKQILEQGMSFSIEPGIYLKNRFGIRIEDIVVVGDKEPDILNNFSKEIMVVK